MKIRKTIYIITGCFLMLLNLLSDIVALGESNEQSNNDYFSFGYFLGSHILFIAGSIFLGLAYKLNKKIKRRVKEGQIQKSIDELGT